jgi:hypothetical protein
VERYANRHHNSGVVGYSIGDRSITVEFRGGAKYRYTVESAGRRNIERMKQLASTGEGLSAFISRVVKDRYAERVG